MYEDTYLGTADSAVRFVNDVGLPNVGINADLGNLVRLHRPVEHWQQMMAKVAPYAKYWHVKNYMRMEDQVSGLIASHPAPLESGIINYRSAIRMALECGFQSAFLCEHYGGDGVSVSAANRSYLRRILPR
jgi:sugar phosphate isomerase/epimerase